MKKKELEVESINVSNPCDWDEEDFGPPVIYYNFRCKKCGYESEMNEANVDVAYGWTKKRVKCSYGLLPVLECPECNRKMFICID